MVTHVRAALILAALLATTPARAEDAKAEFQLAVRYANAGEHEVALPHFQRAYELSKKRPSTILALAQCERELKMYEEAIAHFREYLASTPPPKDSATIQETLTLVEELRRRELEKASKPEPAKEAVKEAASEPAKEPVSEPVHEAPKELPQPRPIDVPPPTLVAPSPAPAPASEEEESSVLSSPLFWVTSAAAVVGGGVALAFVLSSGGPAPYGGSTGITLEK